MKPGYNSRQQRRAEKYRNRQQRNHSVTNGYQEPRLRDILNEKQMDILAQGFMLLRKVCTGTDIDLETGRLYARKTIELIDEFADAQKDDN